MGEVKGKARGVSIAAALASRMAEKLLGKTGLIIWFRLYSYLGNRYRPKVSLEIKRNIRRKISTRVGEGCLEKD